MIVLLIPLFVLIVLFFKISDSSMNLFFWIKIGKKTEHDHYNGKVVWLVGGSSGIGEELALRLASFAPLLILSARRKDMLEEVAMRCQKINEKCQVRILPLDLLEFHALPAKVAEADHMFGKKVDIIILNAGRSQRAEWTDIDPSVDIACYEINALGPTHLARSMLKHRGLHPTSEKRDRLQFVVVSSVAALLPAILSASYAASKAALNQYFRLLAVEMGEKGVDVSIVCPSLVFAPNNPLHAFTETKDQGKTEFILQLCYSMNWQRSFVVKESKKKSIARASNGEILEKPTRSHMNPERAAELILLAGVHKIHESIISASPAIILLVYLNAMFPGIIARAINTIGSQKLRNMRTGKK